MKDLFGQAIYDYQTKNHPKNIITSTNISDDDQMNVSYLFRNFEQMPIIEQTALDLSFGKVLDVGCGAGSHSLYLQNIKNLEKTAIDISTNAIKTCELRGLENCFVKNIFDLDPHEFGTFNTILLLMNGTGICGQLRNLNQFLQQLKVLLTTDGQILIDSSDIIYMFDEDEVDKILSKKTTDYYGELTFNISYKNQKEDPFYWLYLDFETLKNACVANDLNCEKIFEGKNHDYLARITHQKF
ncbi:MAG: hypothetical protein RLZZ312_1687 [Bacteroidota bacterium]|jgi:SAM-dependent methyltransferase